MNIEKLEIIENTKKEFSHFINELYNNKKQVVDYYTVTSFSNNGLSLVICCILETNEGTEIKEIVIKNPLNIKSTLTYEIEMTEIQNYFLKHFPNDIKNLLMFLGKTNN